MRVLIFIFDYYISLEGLKQVQGMLKVVLKKMESYITQGTDYPQGVQVGVNAEMLWIKGENEKDKKIVCRKIAWNGVFHQSPVVVL